MVEPLMLRFEGSFTQQEPIPEAAIEAATGIMRSGRLHRYNISEGELSETALLEQEFAAMAGRKYCLAVASGGYAISCALKALDVAPGEPVLSNAFTLAPVPGAIVAAGARPVLVECGNELIIDFDDLQRKIEATAARILVLSHMRGHICDMDQLTSVCRASQVLVVEDCAHTMGAHWNDVWSGNHGLMACYSTQTYKHVNSGEGGLLTTDATDLMAKATILSGSYMLFGRHLAAPDADEFAKIPYRYPNCSGRMDNLRAAVLRPQLQDLSRRCDAWRIRYRVIERGLQDVAAVRTIPRRREESFVGSSIQFRLPGYSSVKMHQVVERCAERGVELKWFGNQAAEGYTSRFDHWQYLGKQDCPVTRRALASLLDMRLPLTFSVADCQLIAEIIRQVIRSVEGT